MPKFTVIIEETVSQDFDVEANSQEEAIKIARDKYRNGEFVLEPGWIEDVQMAVCGKKGNYVEELWRGKI